MYGVTACALAGSHTVTELICTSGHCYLVYLKVINNYIIYITTKSPISPIFVVYMA